MIVRRLDDLVGGDRDVESHTFHSRRFLLARDGLPYSFHDTVLAAGTTTDMWYRNHIETVYCIEGRGVLTDLERNERHEIRPGTLYCLDEHDRHSLYAETDLRMICVFTPALVGAEVHDEDGAYPLLGS